MPSGAPRLLGNRLFRVAGETGVQVVQPDPITSSTETVGTVGGDVVSQNGDNQTQVNLLTQCNCNCGQDASAGLGGSIDLTANSSSVNVRPVIAAQFASDSLGTVPTQIQVQLTWNNGTPQPWVTFQTTGHSPGDVYQLNVQVSTAVTTTGVYPWTLEIKATLSGGDVIDRKCSGQAPVFVALPAAPIAPGWTIGGEAQLVSTSTGVFFIYGSGGGRFFRTGTGNIYLSPPDDFGSLVKNGDGSFTYTAKDKTISQFNSQGLLTSVTDPQGLARTFSYSAGILTSITEPDSTVTTFGYSGGVLGSIVAPGSRTYTITHDGSGNLSGVTYPDGSLRTFSYDANHRITGDQWGSRRLHVHLRFDHGPHS